MECKNCKTRKLAKEFPPISPSTQCTHSPDCCLRCVVNSNICPSTFCEATIDEDKHTWFISILKCLFREYETTYTKEVEPSVAEEGLITVVTLDGSEWSWPFEPDMKIFDLKKKISDATKCEIKFQKLMFKGKTLENAAKEGKPLTLKSYGVKPFSKIFLLRLLGELPSEYNELAFELSWDYPKEIRRRFFFFFKYEAYTEGYLDASCFIFRKSKEHPEIYDAFTKKLEGLPGINLPLPEMCKKTHTGKRELMVNLKKFEKDVTHLFVVISARSPKKMCHFKNFRLIIKDKNNKELFPEEKVCTEDTESHIVLCAFRSQDAIWRVIYINKPCDGNEQNYKKLKEKVTLMKNEKIGM